MAPPPYLPFIPKDWIRLERIIDTLWTILNADTNLSDLVAFDADHRHDTQTLQLDGVNSDGGAFAFNTTGTVTFNQDVAISGIGDGGRTNYDLKVGDTSTPDYGMIQFGNAVLGRTSYKSGNIDLDGSILFQNIGGPVTSQVEFCFATSTGASTRFALAKPGVGNASYHSRSMLLAGPAPADTSYVTVGYWQTANSIFHNLVCDTAGDGADFGIQNDLEVEGDIFCDSFKESTSGGGVIFKPLADSTSAWVWEDLGGTGILTIDSTNKVFGLGVAPASNFLINASKTFSGATTTNSGTNFSITQDTTSAFNIFGIGSNAFTTHSSGTIAGSFGYFGGGNANSSSDVTKVVGVSGAATSVGAFTPNILIAAGLESAVFANAGAVTFAFSTYVHAPTVAAGTIGSSIGVFIENPTSGTRNLSIQSQGDVMIESNKKLILEGATSTIGDTYLVFDSAGATLDCFVNATEVWNANTTRLQMLLDVYMTNAEFLVFDKASGNGIKVDTTTPTFGFADLLGDVTVKNTGGSRPALIAYRDGLLDFEFAAGEEEYFKYHIPHDYVKGTDIFLHFHWSTNGALVTGGTVTFDYEISYAKAHAQAAFPTSVSGTVASATASSTQYTQELTEVQISASTPSGSQIDTDDLEPDGVIICTAGLNANNLTVSSGGVPDPFIHYVDIHYQTTGLIGTKAKAPDFYA